MKNEQLFQEVENLYRRSNELKQSLNETTEQLNDANRTNVAREKELADMQERLQEALTERADFKDQLERTRAQNDDLHARLSAAENQLALERDAARDAKRDKVEWERKLEAEHRSQAQYVEASQRQLQELERSRQKVEEELQTMTQTMRSMQSRLELLLEEKTELRCARDEAHQALKTSELSFKVVERERNELSSHLQELQETHELTVHKLYESEAARTNVDSAYHQLSEHYEQLHAESAGEIATLRDDNERLRKAVTGARDEVERLSSSSAVRAVELERQANDALSDARRLRHDVDATSERLRKAEADRELLMAQTKELCEVVTDLQGDLQRLSGMVAEREDRHRAVLQQLVDVEARALSQERVVADTSMRVENEVNDQARTINELRTQLERAELALEDQALLHEREYEDIQVSFRRTATRMQELEKINTLQIAQFNSDRQQMRGVLDETNEQLNRALEMFERETRDLEHRMETRQAEAELALEKEKLVSEKLRKDVLNLEHQVQLSANETNGYKGELDALTAVFSDARIQLDNAAAHLSTLEGRNEVLTSQLRSTEVERSTMFKERENATRDLQAQKNERKILESEVVEARTRIQQLTSMLQDANARDSLDRRAQAQSSQLREAFMGRDATPGQPDRHLQQALENVSFEHANAMKAQTTINELELRCRRSQDDLQRANDERSRMREERDAALSEAMRYREGLARLDGELKASLASLHDLSNANQILNDRLRTLTQEKNDTERGINDLRVQAARFQAQAEINAAELRAEQRRTQEAQSVWTSQRQDMESQLRQSRRP